MRCSCFNAKEKEKANGDIDGNLFSLMLYQANFGLYI